MNKNSLLAVEYIHVMNDANAIPECRRDQPVGTTAPESTAETSTETESMPETEENTEESTEETAPTDESEVSSEAITQSTTLWIPILIILVVVVVVAAILITCLWILYRRAVHYSLPITSDPIPGSQSSTLPADDRLPKNLPRLLVVNDKSAGPQIVGSDWKYFNEKQQ